MDRKAIAKETLDIMKQGYYKIKPVENQVSVQTEINIKQDMEQSVKDSILITPAEAEELLEKYKETYSCQAHQPQLNIQVENISTTDAIRKLVLEGKEKIGVLNFASAKNPGGGFLNGARAQEESLAASSTLYKTLICHEEYYRENRAYNSMIYTNYAIYSPDVVFFRDGRFRLAEPVKASVLTLPAVNMGQVILKGEDAEMARHAMKQRMKLALAIFASQGAKNLVLGAYGCGVFRNNPKDIAAWWKELLLDTEMGKYFNSVFHAVLDYSKEQKYIGAFQEVF
ncbi:MAG TPA: TIGR02452 family protein [Lachnospiraceae bacterium]|nr:TIGR02452 family protein [Lachnospiraceae bacterium]